MKNNYNNLLKHGSSSSGVRLTNPLYDQKGPALNGSSKGITLGGKSTGSGFLLSATSNNKNNPELFSSTNKSESVIVRGVEIEREIEKLEKAIKSSNNIQEQRSAIDMKNALHQKAADYYLDQARNNSEIS